MSCWAVARSMSLGTYTGCGQLSQVRSTWPGLCYVCFRTIRRLLRQVIGIS